MIRKVLLGAIAGALLTGTTFAKETYKPLEADPATINFGIISTESTQNLRKQWMPLLEDMEKRLGMEVKPFFAPDYAGIIEAMRFGKVTVAWFGNKSALEAVDRSGAEVFAQQVDPDGTRGYYSHILAQANDKEVNSLEDMFKHCGKGTKDFGIGDPNSTSGFLVPSYYVFALNNVAPRECFKTVRNANHETNMMAVANKQVDYAANNSEQVLRTRQNHPEALANVKVIWTSPLIPSDPLVYRKDLSAEMKDKIAAFFLSYGRLGEDVEQAKKNLALLNLGPFHKSSNAQLYPIRQLKLFKDKLNIQNNENMSEADKKAKIDEIDKQLSELEILSSSAMGVAAN
jgi:phosphonate transport system substrate-binding protein